jgi:deazaflavin-dependent oxidoreductase (nitroreductase family)
MDDTISKERVPKVIWRLLKLPSRLIYALGLGSLQGRFVLLLTTIGRKSGLPRVTPLQYEEVDGKYFVGSARGHKADWYRNILNNPNVRVQVRSWHFNAMAEPINEPGKIADFLELRLRRHPSMVGAMFRAQGYPSIPNRKELEAYAAQRTMVVLRPIDDE